MVLSLCMSFLVFALVERKNEKRLENKVPQFRLLNLLKGRRGLRGGSQALMSRVEGCKTTATEVETLPAPPGLADRRWGRNATTRRRSRDRGACQRLRAGCHRAGDTPVRPARAASHRESRGPAGFRY